MTTADPVVFGIDPSTKRIALGIRQGGEARAFTLTLSPAVGARRLGESLGLIVDWVRLRTADNGAPHGVFIEDPWAPPGRAKGVKEANQMLGVTLAALYVALDPAPPIVMLEASTWKAECGVGGGAGKAKILRWARAELGYSGQCDHCFSEGDKCKYAGPAHDEADSLGVATAGLRILSRRTLFEAAA